MALPASGQISASAINTEFGRASNANFSFATAVNGTYGTINTSGFYPNNTTPHALSEWYSYNHGTALASYALGTCYTPGDGGGYIEVTWSVSSPQGGEYITVEGNISGGDPITSTGSYGPSSAFTSSPSQYNIALGNGASGSVTIKLYSSGAVLLDTGVIGDGIFPT